MKTVIGVTPLYDQQRRSIWMLPGYMDGIHQAGGIPVILPLQGDDAEAGRLLRMVDGLLLTGGQDVDPALYGETPIDACGELCPARDEIEKKYLQAAVSLDMPVFGICRGLQFINAFLGGKLYQDIPTQMDTAVNHAQKPPYDAPAHKVTILPNSPLYAQLETEKLMVNSYHHQGIRVLAPGLLPAAISEDGLVEAVYAPHKKYLQAVQWHPEFAVESDEYARKVFRAFVQACAGKK